MASMLYRKHCMCVYLYMLLFKQRDVFQLPLAVQFLFINKAARKLWKLRVL